MPKKILLLGWLTLLALEIGFLIHVISELHWFGPVQDFWGSIPFIEKTLTSASWFSNDLWVAQNNHRLVLPRLAFLMDYRFFYGSNYFLTGFSLLLLALEALVLYFLVSEKKYKGKKWLIYIPILAVLLLPGVSYNLLNTFNIQWIQCAFFALSACVAYSYGLASGRNFWVGTGIFLAILCCFTTFSLTAIWPALFLLLWLNVANKKQWLILGSVFFIFSVIFVFLLPIDKTFGAGSEYFVPPLLESIFSSSQFWQIIPFIAKGLLHYLIKYLSFPAGENWQTMSFLMTIFSLVWLVIALSRHQRSEKNWQASSMLALMLFVVCLGITTAFGRALMGELSYGIRFYPIALLYWAACLLHIMTCLLSTNKNNSFFVTNILCLVILAGLGVFDAKKISERLAEEHNRYGRMQMAYIAGNLHPNALYENLVPEWRVTSYPGILAAVPSLKSHQWGIFNTDIGRFVLEHPSLPEENMETCISLSGQEKPRNNDTDIRNIIFRHPDTDMSVAYPYLVVYSNKKITGAAFRQRYDSFEKKNKSVWIGMSSIPAYGNDYAVIALNRENKPCRAKINMD